jgi:hypothetical protein
MSTNTHWTATWREALKAERGRQWIYDGTAREVAEAKGWRIVESDGTPDMVLAEAEHGRLIAIGALPRSIGYGFWSVDIVA